MAALDTLSSSTDVQTAIVSALSEAVAVIGADGRLVSFNNAFAEIWPLDPDWLNGGPPLGQVLEALRERRRLPEQRDFQGFKSELTGLIGNRGRRRETLWHLPDGRSLKAVTAPLPDGGLVLIFQDLTPTFRLERSYNEGRAVQQATIEHIAIAIAAFGSDGRLQLHNPAFAETWDVEPEALAGMHVGDFVDATRDKLADMDDWPTYREAMVSRLLSRERGEMRIRRTDGTALDLAHRPLPNGAVLVSYADVTADTRVADALQQRAEALEAANRLKSEFLAKLSYELRTPLTTVSGFAELLAGEYFGRLNGRQTAYAAGIVESVEHLEALIKDILDLTNIEAGLLDLEVDTVDLHALLAGVLGLVRERARRKKVELVFDCPPDIGWIAADAQRLKQVLFHLLNNAETFTPAGGTITLTAKRDREEIAISVIDNGAGIPKADQKRVFQGFERGHDPDLRPGAGLGLTLVRSFIELHGGRVEIASRPGRGTRVTCTLPGG